MKKSEIVLAIDIKRMADELNLSERDLKVALTWSEPKIDTGSINRITSLNDAKKLYKQARNVHRKREIARRALDFCGTLDELELWQKLMSDARSPVLNGLYTQKLRAITTKAIEDSSTFDEIHLIWIKCYDKGLDVEDLLAYQKMWLLVTSTPVVNVLRTFFYHVGTDTLFDSSQQYEILVHACEWSSPESASEALRYLRDYSWNGEQDTDPVKILIQKASQLYKRK